MKNTYKLIIALILVSSCNILPEVTDTVSDSGQLSFKIAQPVEVISTKGNSALDTNSFILSIRNVNGLEIYNGLYGLRPSEIKVPAGTYEVSVVSTSFTEPTFESPQYGDTKVIIVSNGQTANVSFLCKMMNGAVKLSFTDRFVEKYGQGVVLRQNDKSLNYVLEELRYAYFAPGNVEFISTDQQPLFNRVLNAGEIHTLQIDASNNESDSSFKIAIDTSSTAIDETIIVGEDNGGANGQSPQTALSIEDAIKCEGDTVWVWGYVVGTSITTANISTAPPFSTDAHIGIAKNRTISSREEVFPVELSKKALKEALGLMTHPENLGKRIAVRGVVVSSYFGSAGLKSVSDYQLEKE